MDYNFPTHTKRGNTINPADLHNDFFSPSVYEPYCGPDDSSVLADLSSVDSAVDLTSFQEQQWSPPMKLEDVESSIDQFLDLGETSQASNTPSPSADMIFSNANSPGDFVRDLSQISSPETTHDASQDAKPSLAEDSWKSVFATPDAIRIPQTVETPQVHMIPDKTKTRAETQIKVQLVLDPLDDRFEHIHFPRQTLAKPKLLATPEEGKEIESRSEAIYMDLFLVCATAVEKKERMEQALRRARNEEPIPRRQAGVAISEMEKDDPAHPQNGGEVLICEGCKERERKRYDRKKKRADDEEDWWKYEDDRVIMINEKEYKKWKEVESGDQKFSTRAKQVEFAMRIACYCRHQEEKSPVGYRVIFTFRDVSGNCIAQHTSEIFQITDDHKNKEVAPEALPRALSIPQSYTQSQYGHTSNVAPPLYQYSMEGQYSQPPTPVMANFHSQPPTPVMANFHSQPPTPVMANFHSQPPTPVMANFQSPMSPMDTPFHQSSTPNGLPSRQAASLFSNPLVGGPQFARSQPHSVFDTPLLGPTTQVSPEASYLPRPISMDNFNFSANHQYPQHQGFASAPPSAVGTPLNLSRPASPTWEQGPVKKRLACVYFYVEGE